MMRYFDAEEPHSEEYYLNNRLRRKIIDFYNYLLVMERSEEVLEEYLDVFDEVIFEEEERA